jgi:hypothetical protein
VGKLADLIIVDDIGTAEKPVAKPLVGTIGAHAEIGWRCYDPGKFAVETVLTASSVCKVDGASRWWRKGRKDS